MKFTSFKLSIISFNAMSVFNFDSLHGLLISRHIRKRQDKIAEVLLEKNPDIIALQEIHTYYILSALKKKLNYPYVAYKKLLYGPKGGLVVFSKHPFESIEYVDFKQRGSFFNSSFIARVIRNGILVCKLKGFPLTVLNAHATPNLDHDDSEQNRFIKYIESQLEQIAGLTNEIVNQNQNIIVAGDLNVAKASSAYRKFVEISKLKDIFEKFDTPTQHQEYLPRHKKVKRIDYIFTKDNDLHVKVLSTEQLFAEKYNLTQGNKQYLSDHIGLWAKLFFNN